MTNNKIVTLSDITNHCIVKDKNPCQDDMDNKKIEATMVEYGSLINQIRHILVNAYGPSEYPLDVNSSYQAYGFKIIVEKSQNSLHHKYVRVYTNVYDGLSVYSVINDKVDKSKIILTLFEQMVNGREFPYHIFEKVIDRYIQVTNDFEFFAKFEKNPVPQHLKDFFVKSKTYKDTKEQRLCKSFYGYISKVENVRRQASFSFSPSKVEIVLLKDQKGEFVPGFLFNLPVLSSVKFKYAIPMFPDDLDAALDELFDKFHKKFFKCIIDIIGRAEKLKPKEKKQLVHLPKEELIGRFKIAEMLLY